MHKIRRCSRNSCSHPAASTLTYVYADSTAVLGPLATSAEPHSYDLCTVHARLLTAPRGWEVVRLEIPEDPPQPSTDDLLALADAVREAAKPPAPPGDPLDTPGSVERGRRGHLRVLTSD